MKIVIDAFGGDYSPTEMVKGAVTSVNLIDDVNIVLTGDKEKIQAELDNVGYSGDRISIAHAPSVIDCNESPTMAIRQKKDSSLVVGLDLLSDESLDYDAMISCGSTGAVLAGGLFKVGRMAGVLRPALAPLLPTKDGGQVLLIDCGANVDCKPEYLVQFAVMGSAYMKAMTGESNPRVGLLNVGVEDHKGNELTHAVFDKLKALTNINFVGNMEARDLMSGDYDVVVCDGFAGNVALKSIEGAAELVSGLLKKNIMSGGLFAKLGAGLLKKPFKNLKQDIDYTQFGGSPFVGVKKLLIKSHGSSKAKTIYYCVLQAKKLYESHALDKIREDLKILEEEK